MAFKGLAQKIRTWWGGSYCIMWDFNNNNNNNNNNNTNTLSPSCSAGVEERLQQLWPGLPGWETTAVSLQCCSHRIYRPESLLWVLLHRARATGLAAMKSIMLSCLDKSNDIVSISELDSALLLAFPLSLSAVPFVLLHPNPFCVLALPRALTTYTKIKNKQKKHWFLFQ